jgi:EpsI family protein
MTNSKLVWRGLLVASVMIGAHAYASALSARSVAPAHRALRTVPFDIGPWRGQDQPAFDSETLRILRADDYMNRMYVDAAGYVAGLYVAFYASQRSGESIHSPLHCLPGTGWRPLSTTRTTIATAHGPVRVNRLLVEKASARQLVLYWFEGRGRSVASEFENRRLLVWDALRRGRSEGALVRITTPVGSDPSVADATAVRFAQEAFGPLREVLE